MEASVKRVRGMFLSGPQLEFMMVAWKGQATALSVAWTTGSSTNGATESWEYHPINPIMGGVRKKQKRTAILL